MKSKKSKKGATADAGEPTDRRIPNLLNRPKRKVFRNEEGLYEDADGMVYDEDSIG